MSDASSPRMRFVRRASQALALLVLAAACSSSSPEEPPTSDVVLKPNVRILGEASLARLASFSPEGKVVFAGHDDAIDRLAAGDVVAGAVAPNAPAGILRRVTRATRTDAGVELETTRAALTDAIARGKIHVAKQLLPGDAKAADFAPGLPSGFYVGVNDLVLYEKGGARVVANGSISLEPSLDLDVDIDWDGLHSVSFTLGGTQGAAIDLTATAGLSFDEKEDVASYTFTPIIIYAGELPLVFIPRLVLEIGATGGFDATSTVGVVEQARAKVGLAWSGGTLSKIAEVTPTLSAGTPTIGAAASVKGWAGARAEILLYGETGPTGTLDGYLRLAADTTKTPCWALDVGVESRFGLRLQIFGIDVLDESVPVFDASQPLASGACGGTAPTEPPPWAYVYPRLGGDDVASVDAMPDGGLVLAGDSSADAAVTRLAKDGAIVWQRVYPTGKVFKAVRARGDAIFAAGGAWVTKLDAKTGDVLWSYAYGSGPEVRAIDATADGGCILAGLTTSPQNDFDYWFTKLDANGNVTWSKRMGDAKWEQVNAVRALAGGGYALAGQYAPNQDADAFFARLDDAGNVTVQKKYAGTGTFESFDALLPTSDGGFVVVGRAQRPQGGAGWAAKLDANGKMLWSKSFGESGADYLTAVVPIATGFLATGSTGILPTSAWAVALDGTGHPIWSRAYSAVDATKNVEGRGLALLTDASFSFGGTTNAFGDGNLLAVHTTFDGQVDFAAGSGMKTKILSGSSEAPYDAPGVTTSAPVTAYAAPRTVVDVTPAALTAVAKKLSK